MFRLRRRFGLLIGAMLVIAGCGKSNANATAPGGGPPPVSTTNVTVANNYFQPAATSVAVGSTVTWTWSGGVQHNVTFDDGVASATLASGTYSRTFNTPGTYPYHCTIHGAMMSGTVTVTGSVSGY